MVTNEQVELLVKDTSEMQAQILRKVMLATLEQFHDSHMALKKRAESAESRNKRMVELIKELRGWVVLSLDENIDVRKRQYEPQINKTLSDTDELLREADNGQ